MKTVRFLPLLTCMSWLIITNVTCSRSASQANRDPDSTCFYNGIDTCNAKMDHLILSVNLDESYQTIHSFGASDAWTAKFIGTWPSTEKRNRIADLLFSTDTLSDGSPQGIGLSLWRFNIGAGSYGQGEASGIATDWRREECFLNADGTYDWSKEAGNRWFLQAAKAHGVKYVLGFSNSPPVSMTKNGKAFSPGGENLNIQSGRLDDYADFLANVANHFHFDYISPVNEPQWDWKAGGNGQAGQEGSPATDADIAGLTRALSKKLAAQNSTTNIVIGEAGQWDFLYGRNTDGRGDQIGQFFSGSSVNYVGDLPKVEEIISAHSYFTTCPDNALVSTREAVASRVSQIDPTLKTWMTEFGVLGNICDQLNGYPRHTGIDYGLYVAKVLYADLTMANVSSWQWWLAINPYNYSDGLVYINDPAGNIEEDNCKKDGIVLSSKQLWAFGNYARFVRPGMKRIGASVAGLDEPGMARGSLMVSAYKDEKSKVLVIVLVNASADVKMLNLDMDSHTRILNNVLNAYTTASNMDLKRSYTDPENIKIPPRSIVTLTGTYE